MTWSVRRPFVITGNLALSEPIAPRSACFFFTANKKAVISKYVHKESVCDCLDDHSAIVNTHLPTHKLSLLFLCVFKEEKDGVERIFTKKRLKNSNQ